MNISASPFHQTVIYVSSGSNTLVVGIIAALSVILASGVSGVVAWKISAGASRTARDLAREDRKQARIQDAYLTVHLYCDKWARYARWRARVFRPVGELEPDLPVVSETAAAISALVASEEVEAAMDEFNTRLMSFRSAVGEHDDAVDIVQSLIGMSDVATRSSASENARRTRDRLATTAAALEAQAETVHQLMRRELAAS